MRNSKGQFEKGLTPWNKDIKLPNLHHEKQFKKGHIPVNKGKKHSAETRLKMKKAWVGRVVSDETKEKMRKSRIGVKLSEETKLKITRSHKGKKLSPEHAEKNRIAMLGRKHSEETKRKIRENSLRGDKNPNWKGGATPLNKKIRNSFEYKQWRSNVYKRDEWACQTCYQKGKKLNAHHIKSFSKFPDLRFELSNGITLCEECHKLTDNFGFRA